MCLQTAITKLAPQLGNACNIEKFYESYTRVIANLPI
jgi:hypothetical protein